MINDFIKKVAEFHNAFDIKRGNVDVQLRYDLFKEEFEEYKNAKDLIERTDAIVDMLYILCGYVDVHRYDFIDFKLSSMILYEKKRVKKFISENLEDYLNNRDREETLKCLFNCVNCLAYIHEIEDVLPELFQEVHLSNMSKLDENGKPIINELDSFYYDSSKPIGKVLKSELFFEPKLKEILEKHNKLK